MRVSIARPGRLWIVASAALLATILFASNTTAWRGSDLSRLRTPRRYWEDLTIAATNHAPNRPKDVVSIDSPEGADLRHSYRRYMVRMFGRSPLRPWEFWRTVPVKPFLKRVRVAPRPWDDTGRARLSMAAFRVLGGAAPLLPLWLGALVAVPVLTWTSRELVLAGQPVAAVAVPLLLGASPYVVETLSLPYAAVGFYLLGLMTLVPLAVHAVMGEGKAAPLLLRSLLAGLFFAACVLCRSSTVLLFPGFALALAIGAFRAWQRPGSRGLVSWRGLGGTAAAVSVFLLPFLSTMPAQHHEVWLGVWEGLGDFDKTRDHHWNDAKTRQTLLEAGIRLQRRDPVWHNATANEDFFRRRFLADIREDPGWYLAILAKRLIATVGQTRLWLRVEALQAAPPSESVIGSYYRMATTVDWIGVGPWRQRLPMPALMFPTVALVCLWSAGAGRERSGLPRSCPGGSLAVLACMATAGLGMPVAITTASGLETEAFVVVYLVGLALSLDALLGATRRRSTPLVNAASHSRLEPDEAAAQQHSKIQA